VPLTEIVAVVPIGVEPAVVMLSDVLTGELLEPVVKRGFVPKVAVAPTGRPVALNVTLHGLKLPPTASDTVYAAVEPGTTVTLPGRMVMLFGLESVNVYCATDPEDPVAVTLYVATNQLGRLNWSPTSPFPSAVTSTSRAHVWPASSLTLMWTDSPGCQLPPKRVTVAPGG